MTEGSPDNSSDELSEFSDYLNQFKNSIKFDSEICPICGINLSDSIAVNYSPFIKILSTNDKNGLELLITKLNTEEISFKIVEQLDNKVLERISYVYDVFIHIKDCEKYHKLIEKE